jgi:uncharacterized protein
VSIIEAVVSRVTEDRLMSAPKKAHRLKCPICGKPVEFFADPLGPFCSGRCKMVDLSRWLGEDYKFSEPLRPEHFAPFDAEPDEREPEDFEER